MSILRKILATAAAIVVAMASGGLVAQADSTPSVYNTPGGQISGGRLWNTTCEKYSSNIVRCHAEIWATNVKYEGGRYVSFTGWTFNNLSYLPSYRGSWTGNNLGQHNDRWTSGNRTWRTECDTPATGRGGCRSYIWSTKVALKDGRYVTQDMWVFNNIVLFGTSSVPEVYTIPSWIIDQSRLDFTGLGPIRVGGSMYDLQTLGYYKYVKTNGEGDGNAWLPSDSLLNRGFEWDVWMGDELTHVTISKPQIRTVDGAHVGMTVAEVKAIYGDRIRLETKHQPVTGNWYSAVVQHGGDELMFLAEKDGMERQPFKDSDVITSITAKRYSKEFPYRP